MNVVVCLVALIVGADAPPDKKQIAEWIKDLGARQFARRDKAQLKLWETGEPAEAALREAAKSDDAEIKRRAAEILAKFKWGIYPSTPKNVVELIEKYQSSDRPNKLDVVRKLFEQGAAGCGAILRITTAEDDAEFHRELLQIISRESGRAIPRMAAERNHAQLEALLGLSLAGEREAGLPNYVAFHLMRKTLDARIAHFRKQLDDGKDIEKANEILFYLYRAKGDVPSALKAAEQGRRQDLVVAILEEHGMWKELTAREHPLENRDNIERLAFRTTYQRLVGDVKKYDEGVAALRKHAEAAAPDSPERWQVARSLFLNGKVDEGLEIVGKGWWSPMKAEILIARMKYAEAFDLLDKEPQAGRAELYDVLRARTLHFLGKKEEARKLIDATAAKIAQGQEHEWYDKLLDVEIRAGLKELAFEHCAKMLQGNMNVALQSRHLKKLFGDQEEAAGVWWTVLRRKQASEAVTTSMKSLRKLMAGEIKGKELATLMADLEATLKLQIENTQPEGKRQWLQAAGEVALKAGDDALAKVYFEKAAEEGKSQTPMIRWGDHLADKKKWAEAAEAYRAGYEKRRGEPLALFLQGRALMKAGKTKEGEELCDQSHWILLGDCNARLEFARALASRDEHEGSRRERELLLKTCQPDAFPACVAIRMNGIDRYREGKYAEASFLLETSNLKCHRSFINFVEAGSYAGEPFFVNMLRARGLAAAGKYDEALTAINLCLTLVPGNVDIAARLVPLLEKNGKKKEADELYKRMYDFKAGLLKKYPDSAGLLNGQAWLAACCRRNLDEGLKHARRAVELEPESSGFRDTLAEVLFQSGRKAEAIAEMKKCLESSPKRDYYRRQLARFEKGDPKVEVPPEIE